MASFRSSTRNLSTRPPGAAAFVIVASIAAANKPSAVERFYHRGRKPPCKCQRMSRHLNPRDALCCK